MHQSREVLVARAHVPTFGTLFYQNQELTRATHAELTD